MSDSRQQPELLGSRQDETPGCPVLVDDPLQIRKKSRPTLGFVKNRAVCKACQKSLWILLGKGEFRRIFEADLFQPGKKTPSEGGFPGLPGTGDRHHRKRFCKALKGVLQLTFEHAHSLQCDD